MKVSNDDVLFKRGILELKVAKEDGRELSATLMDAALTNCFINSSYSYDAKLLIVVGNSHTEIVGDLNPIYDKKIKTYVLNLSPDHPMRPSFSTLATDVDHEVGNSDLSVFKKTIAFGKTKIAHLLQHFSTQY